MGLKRPSTEGTGAAIKAAPASTSFIFCQVVECKSTDDGRCGSVVEGIIVVYTASTGCAGGGATVDITNSGGIVVEMIMRFQSIIGRLIRVTLSVQEPIGETIH